MRWRWSLASFLMLAALAVWISYETVPSGTTGATHFDTLIVLGCPANEDGTASPEQRQRVMEAVREFRAGRAEHIILTGGAAHNNFVEAEVMDRFALANGVPAEAMLEEKQAQNTIQNIYYSHALMEQHGWSSAEVISSRNHLPRTELILEHWQFPWRTDAARWPPEYAWTEIGLHYAREMVEVAKLRWFGFYKSPYLPGS